MIAFRLLQQDYTLGVAVEALEPWVTVQALQEVTMREGQTLTRLAHPLQGRERRGESVANPPAGPDRR